MKKTTDHSDQVLDAALAAAREAPPRTPPDGFERRVMDSIRTVSIARAGAGVGDLILELWRRCVYVSVAAAGAAVCTVLLTGAGGSVWDELTYALEPLVMQELTFL